MGGPGEDRLPSEPAFGELAYWRWGGWRSRRGPAFPATRPSALRRTWRTGVGRTGRADGAARALLPNGPAEGRIGEPASRRVGELGEVSEAANRRRAIGAMGGAARTWAQAGRRDRRAGEAEEVKAMGGLGEGPVGVGGLAGRRPDGDAGCPADRRSRRAGAWASRRIGGLAERLAASIPLQAATYGGRITTWQRL
jgi:hypothetical protein